MAESFFEIQPGASIGVACPEGVAPSVKAGELLPADKPLFSVVNIDGNKVILGPLKTGENSISIGCADGSVLPVRVAIAEVKKEDLPEKAPPLTPDKIAYPLWLWLAIVFGLLAIIGSYVGWFIWKKREIKKKFVPPPPPERTPEQKLEDFLSRARKEKASERDDFPSVKRLYSEGYELLRGFLEVKVGFKAPEATTKEFVGELKTALLTSQLKVPSAFAGQVESLMFQSDQVRFASETPPAENRQGFLNALEKVRTLS